jgi:hypothetical protein
MVRMHYLYTVFLQIIAFKKVKCLLPVVFSYVRNILCKHEQFVMKIFQTLRGQPKAFV